MVIPTRIPPPEGMPTREESRRELELVLARGRVAAAKKAEAREEELRKINRPQQPHPGTGYVRPLDDFQLAAERLALEDAIGAVKFSDILVVPYALGQHVTFVEGEGPRLDALKDPAALQKLGTALDHAALEREHEANMAAIKKHFAEKRRHIRIMQRAREILGAERFDATVAESRRRRGK